MISLSPKKKPILIKALESEEVLIKRMLEKSFYKFLVYFWESIIPDNFSPNWHIQYLCQELQMVGESLFIRKPCEYDLIINIPPGTSKTTICTIMFPAWCWLRDPTLRILSGSYASELAIEHAVKTRDVLKSELFTDLFGDRFSFKSDMDNKKNYENNQHGQRMACSIGGIATGKHAHLIDIDDPINPKQSVSPVFRKAANDFMTKTLPTRKVDKMLTPQILVMQRLHENDPTGLLLELARKGGRPVKHICLPAEVTDLDNIRPRALKKFYTNGLLDPVRMPQKELNNQRLTLGSMEYAGQFLQSPRTEGGNIWSSKWWKYFDEIPMERPLAIYQSWDTAFKDKEMNDFSVCTTWHEYETGYYLVDLLEEKLQYPDLKQMMRVKYEEHRAAYVLVEDKASGTPAIQELRRLTKIPIFEIVPVGDKVERAHACSPTIEAGNVYIPNNRSWVAKLIDQCSGFPNVENDDIVDSITQFLNFVKDRRVGPPIGAGRGAPRRRGY